MTFSLSFHDRARLARNKRDRYRTDPAYRLQRINEARARRGMEPLAAPRTKSEAAREIAAARPREKGRFVASVPA